MVMPMIFVGSGIAIVVYMVFDVYRSRFTRNAATRWRTLSYSERIPVWLKRFWGLESQDEFDALVEGHRTMVFTLPLLIVVMGVGISFYLRNFLVLFLLPPLGLGLPVLWVKAEAAEQRKQAERQFLDMFSLFALYLSIDNSIISSLSRTAEHASPLVRSHLRRLIVEMQTMPLAEALERLVERTRMESVRTFARALAEAIEHEEEYLHEFLSQQIDMMEHEQMERAEAVLAKYPVQLQVVTFGIVMAIFILILVPMLITFQQNGFFEAWSLIQ